MSHDPMPSGKDVIRALSGLRLLVVEDDALVRKVIVRTAVDCGVEVEEAADGDMATALIARNEYDVVLTDLKMPGVSGLDVMDRVRATHPSTALIVITGFAQSDIEERVSSCGGFLLHKPFNLAALIDALRWAQEQRAKAAAQE